MTVFHLEINDHHGHFGETQAAERAVLCRALADIAQAVGSGKPLVGKQPIMLHGTKIGTFSFGEKAHSFPKPPPHESDALIKSLGGKR